MLPLSQRKALLFFFIIWTHISLLDLFYVSHSGLVFFWQENSQVVTLLTHLFIALFTIGFYGFFHHLRFEYQMKGRIIRDPIWMLCSVCLALTIGAVLV